MLIAEKLQNFFKGEHRVWTLKFGILHDEELLHYYKPSMEMKYGGCQPAVNMEKVVSVERKIITLMEISDHKCSIAHGTERVIVRFYCTSQIYPILCCMYMSPL